MDEKTAWSYFNQPGVAGEYALAAAGIGLWESEKIIFGRYFGNKGMRLLDLGCGAGRIVLGMRGLGYFELIGVDYCPSMIREAIRLRDSRNLDVRLEVGDATRLVFDVGSFDGVIFGFNGLMQIPFHERRLKAMAEVYRVLKDDGIFIFTAHDRYAKDKDSVKRDAYWEEEKFLWAVGKRDPELLDFGDLYYETAHGRMFIHVPSEEEVLGMLAEVGFELIECLLRSEVAKESAAVEEFSDNTRFWVVRKKTL